MPRVDESYLASRRRQIMDAAITCCARDGFHRTTMQDIVRETGLSAGAIYRYFPAKEDIVAAIAAEHHAAEAAAFAEVAADGGDLDAALRRLVRVSLGRLTDPDEQRWRRVTVQVWGEALRSDRVMSIVRGGLDEPVGSWRPCSGGARPTAACHRISIPRPPRASAPRSSRAWSCSRRGTRSSTSRRTPAPSSPWSRP